MTKKFEHLGEVVETSDGSLSLKHPDHNECYHSHAGALQEARKLYIEKSGFLDHLGSKECLRVLDVGLGLSYNAMSTIDAWSHHPNPGDLKMLSLEINPDLVKALAANEGPWQVSWPELWKTWGNLLKQDNRGGYSAIVTHESSSNQLEWFINIGDGREILRNSIPVENFDFVWQDPFSPEKNPSMWDMEWFRSLVLFCSQNATLATYSVARKVRDALTEGGWTPEKINGYGSKRHWLLAQPK